MKILLTGAGGAAAISVWKSIGKEHDIYMADMDPCASGLYLVPSQQRLIIPPGDSSDFVPTLLKLCQKHHIHVLIPTVDTELFKIAAARDQFQTSGVKIPLSSAESLERCRDKYALLTHCQETGFTAEFLLLTEQTNLAELHFPCFAKPRRGSGSNGAMMIHQAQEIDLLPKDGSYLIQELLSGEEYSVDIYIHSDGQCLV